MTAKEYLKQIEYDRALIRRGQERLVELSALTTSLKGVTYDHDRVQTSGTWGMDSIERIIDLELKLRAMVFRYIELSERIIGQINDLGDVRASEILYLRYVDLMRWEEIAVKMHMGIRGVYKAHGRALALFTEKYKLFI